ncbi:hypothetical protein OHB26_05750 [Nocardia sp. NBC_01503]|uniref:hypothetical protein n=1 Tax=Nocardia sp. NBC_01503 TaxID=2975997 RepID=UPI002E7B1AE3|nr:hypothetical protein [Nocardia sp. NBC_01503]WTL33728.1 hypothetical protein OHB26_05750 [Nocardia sp. NBC_01503]
MTLTEPASQPVLDRRKIDQQYRSEPESTLNATRQSSGKDIMTANALFCRMAR